MAHADDELTRVGPGSACGEYLRRYSHPVAIAAELEDLPLALVFQNLRRYLAGDPLQNIVRPELGY